MRRFLIGASATGALLLTLLAGCHAAGTTHRRLAIDDLPREVRRGFESAYPGARLREAERETYPDGTVHYELEYATADGHKAEVEFNEAGEALPEH